MCIYEKKSSICASESACVCVWLTVFSLNSIFENPCFFRPEVNLKKYTGCLKEIEISRTPYNILSSPDFVGLTKGCTLEVSLTSMYFGFNGYKCFLASDFMA